MTVVLCVYSWYYSTLIQYYPGYSWYYSTLIQYYTGYSWYYSTLSQYCSVSSWYYSTLIQYYSVYSAPGVQSLSTPCVSSSRLPFGGSSGGVSLAPEKGIELPELSCRASAEFPPPELLVQWSTKS